MITIRRSHERGHFDHGWLDTRHTFSFGDYRDPAHMGFRTLRVMNEDRVQPGRGFGTHGHQDMEIISYVLEGALEHRDSLGNGSVLRAGDFQRLSAGTGIRHSEFNPSQDELVHFYQIWLLPQRSGLTPGYEELRRTDAAPPSGLRLVASPDGGNGSLTIHQDARVLLGSLDPHQTVTHTIAPGRHAWLQVLRGEVNLGPDHLTAGDGAAISGESALEVEAQGAAEIMVFDLG